MQKSLFDRILDWAVPAAMIAPVVPTVVSLVATAPPDVNPVWWPFAAGLVYLFLLLPVGIPVYFVFMVAAVVAGVIQEIWRAARGIIRADQQGGESS